MAGTSYDMVINGTKCKVLRGEGGYTKRYVRREIELQLLSQGDNPSLSSRSDTPSLYQTSWADGAQWWKPLMAGQVSSYFQSNHMDVWSEPGKVVPGNQVAETTDTNIHDVAALVVADSDLYTIGSTVVVDSTYFDVYKWTPASNAFVQETGYTSGVNLDPVSMSFDSSDQFVYILDADTVARFHPSATKSVNANWITGQTFGEGSVVTAHNDFMIVYNGDKLYTIDKATPELDQIGNDGLGPEFLRGMAHSAGAEVAKLSEINLMVGTPEGLYYVKNVYTGGQPTPYVFRVDRNAAGAWIVNPIATLPAGSVALNVTFHLGSVIVSTSPDWRGVLKNTADFEVVLYHITQGGSGALGSMLGGRDELDESPFKFLQAEGPYLYLSGGKRLWVYDAIRGGLHTVFDFPTVPGGGVWADMAQVENSAGEILHLFTRRDRYALRKLAKINDPDTVTNFGDDLTHYILDSNYFDGGLPMELKELTKVAVQHDRIDGSGDQQWTVRIAVDDAALFDALASDSAGTVHKEGTLSGTIGHRFQYQLIYQTKNTVRLALRSVLVTFATGELVAEWELLLNGTEMLNIDNEVQDEAAFLTALEVIAGTEAIITLSDNYKDQEQDVDTATTSNVKVRLVEIRKDKPGESVIRVVLREP